MVMIYSFYLFNRGGDVLCYREWHRTRKLVGQQSEQHKLMFGMLFALKNFCVKLSPVPGAGVMRQYVTPSYALHLLETPTGVRLVLLTSRDAAVGLVSGGGGGGVDDNDHDMVRLLWRIYSELYVEYVAMNPLHREAKEPIRFDRFIDSLDRIIDQINLRAGATHL